MLWAFLFSHDTARISTDLTQGEQPLTVCRRHDKTAEHCVNWSEWKSSSNDFGGLSHARALTIIISIEHRLSNRPKIKSSVFTIYCWLLPIFHLLSSLFCLSAIHVKLEKFNRKRHKCIIHSQRAPLDSIQCSTSKRIIEWVNILMI